MMGAYHKALFPYQKEGAVWLSTFKNAILADGMRVGKTPTSIAAADIVGARNVLVVCPGIARVNWEREFQRWQMLLRDTCTIMSSKDRPTGEMVAVSYELICDRNVLVSLLEREWDVLIVDEAHYVKNPAALRTQVLYGAKCDATRGLASRAKRVWLLTGTPIPNALHEMYPHCRALFPEAFTGLHNYTSWKKHFTYETEGEFGSKVVSSLNVPDFVSRMKPFVKRRLLKDVQPDLPPLRWGHVVVQPASLPPRSDFVVEQETVIRAAIDQAVGKSADDSAALTMAQSMHNSSLLKWTGIAKASAVAEYVKTEMENDPDLKKLVIFAKHSEVFKVLKGALPYCEVINGQTPTAERQPIIDAFQGRVPNRRIDVLAVHIDIASTAIDLTAARDVVFAETGWVPKDIMQAAMRCMGINQKRPVLARIMSLKGSLDEAVTESIVRKHRQITKIEAGLVS